VARPRAPGSDDATVEALGKLSAALEVVENARGLLYGFHRMTGEADLALQEALTALAEAGHHEVAADISEVLVGRDVVGDNWTFEIVEAYDSGYWQVFRAAEQHARDLLAGGHRHVFEAEMKVDEQSSVSDPEER
jgi:hypothetical protein